MENLTNWEIVGIIVLVLIFGGVVWRIAKGVIKIVIVGLLVLAGIYFLFPDSDARTEIDKIVNVAKPQIKKI